MTATPMVRFHGVTKRYGPLTVLDSLDLDVARGEKVAIIGPSGSGKTTVLRMLMTLETIDDGVIYVEGQPLTHEQRNGALVPAGKAHTRKVRGKIGMVFQSFNLFFLNQTIHRLDNGLRRFDKPRKNLIIKYLAFREFINLLLDSLRYT